ncbi:RagB/SusD family nutrient uptake outer membrane protein [Parabacteroides bouchesdurhonensis]|uniref:RagB/SusD family nutrient uptake outer membrane protein n=1 Tax=Parabacteroides bouchesdurhonensis TaxID=1936995 RepID=UPI000E503EC9|nr:RagB/SusD family nutrient uptake outer membrane protein [Parabacteroides bouchesdurhonensis]RHJ93531.1 RagB/SusD family nutrient uptake outer membrane protein [Bacteroides sp. AM07-16]
MKNCKYIFVILSLFCFMACNVDPVLVDRYSEEIVYENEENFDMRIYTFYEILNGYGSGLATDVLSDLVKINQRYNDYNYLALGLTRITSSANLLNIWDNRYNHIRFCNEFLRDTEKYGDKLPDEIRKRGEAEVRFFRAMMYFDLARNHQGSVVLIKEITSESLPICEPQECWDFIAEDLDFAGENLPEKWIDSKRGRITKGGAYGLKAKAMLYAQRWKEASDAAAKVIALADKGIYRLLPNYEDVFKEKRNDEAIIEYAYHAPELTHSFDKVYAPPSDPDNSRGEANPTEECVSEFQMADGRDFDWNDPEMAAAPYENREPRFYASILYNGATWKASQKPNNPTIETFVGGKDGFTASGNLGTVTGYYIRKLLDESLTGYANTGEQTYYYMRYAEVLLIHAEALARQGDIQGALFSLNKVRERAKMKNVTATNLNEFMKLLRHERIVELAFEGHRYWDLRRWDLAKSVLNGVNFHGCRIVKTENGDFIYELVDCDEGAKRYYDPKYNRFPIPKLELDRNLKCEQFDEWK